MYMELIKANWKIAAAGVAAKVAYDFIVDPYLVSPIRQGYLDETNRVGIEWGSTRINYEEYIKETGEPNAYIRMGRFGNPYFDYELMMKQIGSSAVEVERPAGPEVERPAGPEAYVETSKIKQSEVNYAEDWMNSHDRFAEMVNNTTSMMPEMVKGVVQQFTNIGTPNEEAYAYIQHTSEIDTLQDWMKEKMSILFDYEDFDPSFCTEDVFDDPAEEDPLDWTCDNLVDESYKAYHEYECDYIESMGIKLDNQFMAPHHLKMCFGDLFDQDFESGEPESGLHDWQTSLEHGQCLFVINHRCRSVFVIRYRECEDWDADTSWSVDKEHPDLTGVTDGPLTKCDKVAEFYKK